MVTGRRWIFDNKPSRMPIPTFVKVYNAAVRTKVRVHVSGVNTEAIDSEEMECLLANMIYKVRAGSRCFAVSSGAHRPRVRRGASRATLRTARKLSCSRRTSLSLG